MSRRMILMMGLGLALALAPLAAQADQTYVLSAAKWTAAQTAAVEAAGGSVVFAHGATGIGSVTSSNPNFLDEVLASNKFQQGAMDEMVQWQPDNQWELLDQTVTPGDETFFGFQWNMLGMEAPDAWAAGCDGAGARIAIIDGGIYDIHPDLAPNLDVACSTSFVPGLPFNYDTGTFWHGTHVAGIAAAADNGFGVIGVAPAATIMGVKALHSGTGSFSWVIGGILFASDPGSFPGFAGCQRADIINMSLGAEFPKRAFGAGPLLGALSQAVNFAASQGVLVISAAANSGIDYGQFQDWVVLPAQAGSGLAVSATGPVGFAFGNDEYRRFAPFSNYGEDLVSVAAPGGNIESFPNPFYYYDWVLSTCRGSSTPPTFNFCFAFGTSMAAPAASGVAALIVGANPGISLGALKAKLLQTADDEGPIGKDQFYGHGFVNAYRACTE